jgi:hypothetical protein
VPALVLGSSQLRPNDHSGWPDLVQYLFPNQPTEDAAIRTSGAFLNALTTKTNIVLWLI